MMRATIASAELMLWFSQCSSAGRVVFRFEDGEAVNVDLIDYH